VRKVTENRARNISLSSDMLARSD